MNDIRQAADRVSRVLHLEGGYESTTRVSGDKTRATMELSRGSVAHLMCCPALSLCFCPYNKWILRLWVQGGGIRYELSRTNEHCMVHCCFSGLVGMLMQERHFAQCKVLVRRALTTGEPQTARYAAAAPSAPAMEREFAVPGAVPAGDKGGFYDPPPAYDASVPIAMAVEEVGNGAFSSAPIYTAQVVDAWLVDGKGVGVV
jgi:hypothetical protein